MMYVVEYCPNDLFSPGATFTCTSFDYTLEMGSWPEGIIFTGRGRRIIIQDGQAVELKRVSNDQGTHWQNDITQ